MFLLHTVVSNNHCSPFVPDGNAFGFCEITWKAQWLIFWAAGSLAVEYEVCETVGAFNYVFSV